MNRAITRRHGGFTLIEMIGVLAIISTLAAVLVPNVVKTVDEAVMDAEGKDLTTLASALDTYTSTNKRIPNAAGWVAALAGVTSMSSNKINLNERGFTRGYYVDPRFFTTTATAFAGYTQTSGRTSAPFSPRIMIVSDLTRNAPAAPTTAAAFNAIWNQTAAATVKEGTRVRVQRMHLGSTFVPVLLTNQFTSAVGYSIEAGGAISLPAVGAGGGTGVTRYLIKGSKVSLRKPPFPTGALERAVLANGSRELSYVSSGGATPVWSWSAP
ncbi:MAG: prepilin-type N-terminal cleavage/methylation domain-containing protein [Proteobacteria bacterium]|nr:prepilin-type N-terminal cleavage/methylation domain-containing protein [Pseudomonadota bacterium]